MYSPVSLRLRPLPSSYRPSVVDLPYPHNPICGTETYHPQNHDDDNDNEEEDAAESEENDKQDGLQPLADGLVTLSTPQIVMVQPAQSDIIKVWVETSNAWPHLQYNSVLFVPLHVVESVTNQSTN